MFRPRDRAQLARVEDKLDALLALQVTTAQKEETTMAAIDDKIAALNAAVSAETDIDKAALAALQGQTALIVDLRNQLASQGVPQAVLDQLDTAVATMTANHDTLAAGITANTQPPPPAPAPAA